jgi:ABC-type Mn2+/Zn2+ transport system permease subunit
MMAAACVLGAILSGVGLVLSLETNLPSGATIILLAGSVYFASLLANVIHRSVSRVVGRSK